MNLVGTFIWAPVQGAVSSQFLQGKEQGNSNEHAKPNNGESL